MKVRVADKLKQTESPTQLSSYTKKTLQVIVSPFL